MTADEHKGALNGPPVPPEQAWDVVGPDLNARQRQKRYLTADLSGEWFCHVRLLLEPYRRAVLDSINHPLSLTKAVREPVMENRWSLPAARIAVDLIGVGWPYPRHRCKTELGELRRRQPPAGVPCSAGAARKGQPGDGSSGQAVTFAANPGREIAFTALPQAATAVPLACVQVT